MICVLNGTNARVFAKAVQALSKLGPDLYIEADSEALLLQAVNGNKSAVATFKFRWAFFDSYQMSTSTTDENYCRLSMKAFLGVFRKMRMVDSCQLEIDIVHSKVVVEMKCRHQTKKHAVISIIDDQNIAADIPIDDAPNVISGSYQVFVDILRHFQAGEDELTLKPQSTVFRVQNYVEGSWSNPKFVRARLALKPKEFSVYSIDEDTWITFCLREFRTLVAFAEALHEEITIKYSAPGSPAIFNVSQPTFEASLIMSTLSPDDITLSESCAHRPLSPSATEDSDHTEGLSNGHNVPVSDKSTPDFRFERQSPDIPRKQPQPESASVRSNRSQSIKTPPVKRRATPPPDSSESEVIVKFVETDELEQIPQSPEGKQSDGRRRLRSVFVRCFEATYVPQEPSPNSELFVPDSDDEM